MSPRTDNKSRQIALHPMENDTPFNTLGVVCKSDVMNKNGV